MTGDKPTLLRFLIDEPLYLLLTAVPAAIILEVSHANGLWIFIVSAIAIIPLAGLMGRATESLASSMGPGVGGLLNATFGNAAELIIALLALSKGEAELVKASITGSIIGNILLVLGLAILVGGLRYPRQVFNVTAASMGATLLALATIGLIVPTLYFYASYASRPTELEQLNIEYLSEEIAVVLAIMYVLSLVFSLKTHRHLYGPGDPDVAGEPEWGRTKAFVILLVATIGVAVMSEFLVGSVRTAAEALGMNRVFIGVIVVAIIGNAAEHSTAVLVARKNQMDLAVHIAVGSSIQVALFVAPVLVLAGFLMGRHIDLHFSLMEVVAVAIAVAVMSLVSQDGETHWLEGALLLAVYFILALAFYHLPVE